MSAPISRRPDPGQGQRILGGNPGAVGIYAQGRRKNGGGGSQRSVAAMANLAEGIQGLVKNMRNEQQMLRDWIEAQQDEAKCATLRWPSGSARRKASRPTPQARPREGK
jgi:hypothetical protein